MSQDKSPRRQFLKIGGAALAMIPIMIAAGRADAAANETIRKSLKYQAKPEGDKNCANCVQFVAGKTPKDMGTCKVIPNDTEISPQGYCMAWTKKA